MTENKADTIIQSGQPAPRPDIGFILAEIEARNASQPRPAQFLEGRPTIKQLCAYALRLEKELAELKQSRRDERERTEDRLSQGSDEAEWLSKNPLKA